MLQPPVFSSLKECIGCKLSLESHHINYLPGLAGFSELDITTFGVLKRDGSSRLGVLLWVESRYL